MNKLIVSQIADVSLKEEEVLLTNKEKKVTFHIAGHVKIFELVTSEEEDIDFTFILEQNSTLDYYRFANYQKAKGNMTFISNEDSTLNFHFSFFTSKETEFNISNVINSSFVKSKLSIKAVSINEGSCKMKADGEIKGCLSEIDYVEDIKVLTLSDALNEVKPNLFVSSDNIKASHNTTIGCINPDDLFYLQSKGLSEASAINLMKDGFILSNFKEMPEWISIVEKNLKN